MGKTYQRAGSDITSKLSSAMERWHSHLVKCDVTLDVLIEASHDKDGVLLPSLKSHGYAAAAVVSVTSLKHRALGNADALIVIDEYAWRNHNDIERLAMLDHELEHIQVCAVGGGFVRRLEDEVVGHPVRDDLQRPKLKLRKHDWQLGGFKVIAERHGTAAVEVQAAQGMVRDVVSATGRPLLAVDLFGSESGVEH